MNTTTVRTPLALALIAAIAGCAQAVGVVPAGPAAPSAPASSFSATLPALPTLASPAWSNASSVSGRLVRLAGPLTATAVSARLPVYTDKPKAGQPVAGATVYLVDAATGIVSPGVPASPLAVTQTNAHGDFTLPVPSSYTEPQIGVIAIAGNSAAIESGVTSRKLTVAHVIFWISTYPESSPRYGLQSPGTLYVDSLTSDETYAFQTLNASRAKDKLAPLFSDTVAQMTARVLAAYAQANHCHLPSGPVPAIFNRLGVTLGVVSGSVAPHWVEQDVTWPFILAPQNVKTKNLILNGFHAIYNGSPCPSKHPNWPTDYFSSVVFQSNAP